MGSPTAPVADNYFESLGLAFDPFAAGAMPAFFFVGGQRRFLVQRAVHMLYFSGAMVLLLGARGAGKSRLLDEVGAELRDLADICRIDATVLMDGVQIRAQLAQAIGLSSEATQGTGEFVLALSRARPADAEPQPVVLLIDAAHLLSIEAVEETVTLVQSAGGRLRLLLAGEAELATSWQQADAGAAETLQLPALDRQETADYLHTRLQAAGAVCAMPFDNALLDELFAQSGGNIGAIHEQTARLLVPAQQTPSPRRMRPLPILHIGVIAALLAVVILLVLYRGRDAGQAAEGGVPTPTVSGDKRSVPLSLPDAASLPAEQSPMAAAADSDVRAEPAAESEVPINRAPKPPQSVPKAVKPVNTETVKPVAIAAATSKPVAKAAQEDAATGYVADERELLALPSTQFMLQLLGAESRSTVDKFAAGAGRGQHLFTYRTQLRGKPWFIVLTGTYPTKAAAQAAVVKMPEALRKQQPWPRSVANVQADIRAHSGRP